MLSNQCNLLKLLRAMSNFTIFYYFRKKYFQMNRCNRPFICNVYIVLNQPYWMAKENKQPEETKKRTSSSLTFLCFEIPGVYFAIQYGGFSIMWPFHSKALFLLNTTYCSIAKVKNYFPVNHQNDSPRNFSQPKFN